MFKTCAVTSKVPPATEKIASVTELSSRAHRAKRSRTIPVDPTEPGIQER